MPFHVSFRTDFYGLHELTTNSPCVHTSATVTSMDEAVRALARVVPMRHIDRFVVDQPNGAVLTVRCGLRADLDVPDNKVRPAVQFEATIQGEAITDAVWSDLLVALRGHVVKVRGERGRQVTIAAEPPSGRLWQTGILCNGHYSAQPDPVAIEAARKAIGGAA